MYVYQQNVILGNVREKNYALWHGVFCNNQVMLMLNIWQTFSFIFLGYSVLLANSIKEFVSE